MFMLLKQGIPAAACKSCRRFLSDGHSPTCPSVIGTPMPEHKWGSAKVDEFKLSPLNTKATNPARSYLGYILNDRWAIWVFLPGGSGGGVENNYEAAVAQGDRFRPEFWRLGKYTPGDHNMNTDFGEFRGTLAEAKLKLKEIVKDR